MALVQSYITLDGLPVYRPEVLEAEVAALAASNLGGTTGLNLDRIRGKVNSFTHPRGFDPGRGYLLMLRRDAEGLDLTITTHQLKFIQAGGPSASTVSFTKLLITSIEEITGGESSDLNALCLVELADLRILGPMTSINKSYNVLLPDESDYYSATKNSSSDWTYLTLVQDIWTFMPSAFGSLGVTNADFPASPELPENYIFHGMSAWDALRRVCQDTNHILTLTRSGGFAVEAAFNSLGNFASDRESASQYILYGSHSLDAPTTRIPNKVRVFFPWQRAVIKTNTDQSLNTFKSHWVDGPLYSVDVNTSTMDSSITTITGTIHPIYDSLAALGTTGGTPSNSSDLSTRATTLATEFINSRVQDKYESYRYSGPRSFSPDSDLACVCYRDFGDGIITDLRTVPKGHKLSPLLDVNKPNTRHPIPVTMPIGEMLVKNATGSDIAAGSSGTFQIWTGTPGSESSSGLSITAYNKSSVAFKNGKFGSAAILHGQMYAVPWQT